MIALVQPRLVVVVPEAPETGVLYVSVEYATTLHLCVCGCGHEIVLGISPDDWQLCWDGQTVSVSPSVGNWSLPCQSHYFIRRNRVVWAPPLSHEEISRGRGIDARRKVSAAGSDDTELVGRAPLVVPSLQRRWRRLLKKLGLRCKEDP